MRIHLISIKIGLTSFINKILLLLVKHCFKTILNWNFCKRVYILCFLFLHPTLSTHLWIFINIFRFHHIDAIVSWMTTYDPRRIQIKRILLIGRRLKLFVNINKSFLFMLTLNWILRGAIKLTISRFTFENWCKRNFTLHKEICNLNFYNN